MQIHFNGTNFFYVSAIISCDYKCIFYVKSVCLLRFSYRLYTLYTHSILVDLFFIKK